MRYRAIRYCYFVLIFLIVVRLWYWQILKSDDLVAKAESQRLISEEIPAPRGEILFADRSVLASIQPTFLLFAQPKIIPNKESVARTLADVLWSSQNSDQETAVTDNLTNLADASAGAKFKEFQDVKKSQIDDLQKNLLEKLSKDLFWVALVHKLNYETKVKIEKLEIRGLGFDSSSSRFYPEGSASAHLLGFVGADSFGVDTGYFGLEGYYNGELKGKAGTITQERDAQGVPILIGRFLSKEPKQGKTLVSNIDRTVQYIVEEKLKKGLEKFGARQASAVVMDPKTGDILALASFPNYDPGRPGEFPAEVFRDPITVDSYEPGSTFKVLVMAAALNEGLIKRETICDICNGPVEISGYSIRTWNDKYNPDSTMDDVIIHSDNTGMVFVSKKLGIDKMYNYIQSFGFGRSTNIDLQDEQSPDLRPKESWKEIDLATASFGQGISATALQLVGAIGAIANGGRVMEPHVIGEVIDGDKKQVISPRVVSTPIKPEVAEAVKQMMVRAVDEGEAKAFKPKGFLVAGKTGTAQIPVAGHYDPTKTVASFVGFAPADDPKFIMLVRYDQPTASIYGAETAAPTFFEIAKDLFNYYGIVPSEL